jgi:hypothetical protein
MWRTDSSNVPEYGRNSLSAAIGEQYCARGRSTGETCYYVTNVGVTLNYYNASGVFEGTVRNVCVGSGLGGTSSSPGDSGGPAYTFSGSGVKARGITSGRTGILGNVFTDIVTAFWGLPGDIDSA